jgi:CBS domain
MEPLPVRRRLTVLRDGSARASDLVFCERSGRSVPLSRCATCGHGGEVERDASGRNVTVECNRFALSSTGAACEGQRLRGSEVTRVAAILPVGLSLVRPVICLSSDVPLRVAARTLAAEPSVAYGIAVVDESHRFVGVLPHSKVTIGLVSSLDDVAAMHVATEWGSIEEGASFGAAFGAMAATHARELIVLGEGRRFVGVVRDIDALRFVANVSRTGLRPKLL